MSISVVERYHSGPGSCVGEGTAEGEKLEDRAQIAGEGGSLEFLLSFLSWSISILESQISRREIPILAKHLKG
jgi:hypothetical protein